MLYACALYAAWKEHGAGFCGWAPLTARHRRAGPLPPGGEGFRRLAPLGRRVSTGRAESGGALSSTHSL